MASNTNSFGAAAEATLSTSTQTVSYYRLDSLAELVPLGLDRLPYTVKILLENTLRHSTSGLVTEGEIKQLAAWRPGKRESGEFPFLPARVLLQDFTGVPAVVDLAAMRSALARAGGQPSKVNPLVAADLVIDHSVQVDVFGSMFAFRRNVEREYERNRERYALLRWGQAAFDNFRVVPPGTGICHQVNLEFLGKVIWTQQEGDRLLAYPDTLVGTDSHTTMINGLGVLGWGVGGIEAEAVLLGQPIYLLTPEVVGFRLTGEPPEGVTATDLVLTVAQILRKTGVVGKFVEFFGPSLHHLALPDRATISNMSPEYGATSTIFPVDDVTLAYLRLTGRSDELVELVERYTKEQGLFREAGMPDPEFDQVVELDLSTLEPSLAGPARPQDRVPLSQVGPSLQTAFKDRIQANLSQRSSGEGSGVAAGAQVSKGGVAVVERDPGSVPIVIDNQIVEIGHGSVVIAAITSCTNTSNPQVMVAAGLLAKKAVERGLDVSPHVKTSLAPGSGVVTAYLDRAGLTPYLEALRFHLVGYGCTTCIGNSGPLPEPVAEAVQENDLVVAAVLSGNRNFEGRIHQQARASYLASPPLVVAFAIAGTLNIDLTKDPIGYDPNNEPVYLRDIWPTSEEIRQTIIESVTPDMFRERYSDVFTGDEHWQALPLPEQGDLFSWDDESTYVREPTFFEDLGPEPPALHDIDNARVLCLLGDSVTTDHISPAGAIQLRSPAGRYLELYDVPPRDFNSYGSRRGNHEVMVRGTFANIRLRNQLADGQEGNWTKHIPSGEILSIFDAASRYQEEGTPLLVIAGKEYGSGSSRDWAAKGTLLLGVQAVIAESFERIHRSNLIGMGVLPLQFKPGESAASLGLTGSETYDLSGIAEGFKPGAEVKVKARREDGSEIDFSVVSRIDSSMELEYYRHGGILQMVLRRMLNEG